MWSATFLRHIALSPHHYHYQHHHLLNYHHLFHSSLIWSVDATGVSEDSSLLVLHCVWLCVCQKVGGCPRLPRPLASRLG